MSGNVPNQVSFLRTTRQFPEELHNLTVELNRSYVDIANCVNTRIAGIFSTNRPAQNGENWFLDKAQRQQGLRQVYTFTGVPVTIPHGINFSTVERFTRLWGTYTDGTNWYGILGATNVAIAGQIQFYIDPTNIVFITVGSPLSTKGSVVIEWISNV